MHMKLHLLHAFLPETFAKGPEQRSAHSLPPQGWTHIKGGNVAEGHGGIWRLGRLHLSKGKTSDLTVSHGQKTKPSSRHQTCPQIIKEVIAGFWGKGAELRNGLLQFPAHLCPKIPDDCHVRQVNPADLHMLFTFLKKFPPMG